jgi:hypothetical protein
LIFELALLVIDDVDSSHFLLNDETLVAEKKIPLCVHRQFHDVLPVLIHLPTETNSLPVISLALTRCHLHAAQLQDAGECDIIAAYTC